MIDKVKFRELWEANNGPNPGRELFLHCGEPHSDLIDFLLSHASELLALVEASQVNLPVQIVSLSGPAELPIEAFSQFRDDTEEPGQ